MKIYTQIFFLSLCFLGTVQAQSFSTSWLVDSKQYPSITANFTLYDSIGKIMISRDIAKSTFVQDSESGIMLTHFLTTAQADSITTRVLDSVERIDSIQHTGDPIVIHLTPHQKLDLMIVVDVSDEAQLEYENISNIENMLHHFVNVMNFDYDKVTIAVANDHAHLLLDWTNKKSDIDATIDDLGSHLLGGELHIKDACMDTTAGSYALIQSYKRNDSKTILITGGKDRIAYPKVGSASSAWGTYFANQIINGNEYTIWIQRDDESNSMLASYKIPPDTADGEIDS